MIEGSETKKNFRLARGREDTLALILVLFLSYIAGSFPSAWLAGRLAGIGDIRKAGSGNPGATNTLRVLGWRYALPVLVLDAFKGAAAVLFVSRLAEPDLGTAGRILGASGAILGHSFPVFLGFRGGKGVATGAGALVALAPPILGPCLLLFVALVTTTGYVSLASIAAALAILPSYLLLVPWLGGDSDAATAVFLGLASALVILLHRKNIRRLLAGTESRLERLQLFRRRPSP